MTPEELQQLITKILADPNFSASVAQMTNDGIQQGVLSNEIRGQLAYQLDDRTRIALKNDVYYVGTATLSAGTIAISNYKIRTTSIAMAAYQTPAGTIGVLKAVCTDGQVAITSCQTSGATQTLDTSVVQFLVIY